MDNLTKEEINETPFSNDETLQVSGYFIVIFFANVQTCYIHLFFVQAITARLHFATYTGLTHFYSLHTLSISRNFFSNCLFPRTVISPNSLRGYLSDGYDANHFKSRVNTYLSYTSS